MTVNAAEFSSTGSCPESCTTVSRTAGSLPGAGGPGSPLAAAMTTLGVANAWKWRTQPVEKIKSALVKEARFDPLFLLEDRLAEARQPFAFPAFGAAFVSQQFPL